MVENKIQAHTKLWGFLNEIAPELSFYPTRAQLESALAGCFYYLHPSYTFLSLEPVIPVILDALGLEAAQIKKLLEDKTFYQELYTSYCRIVQSRISLSL